MKSIRKKMYTDINIYIYIHKHIHIYMYIIVLNIYKIFLGY